MKPSPNKKQKSFILYFLIGLLSCNSPKAKVILVDSDTAKVLKLAIRTAFYHDNLPDISALKRKYRFNDSILFTTESLPLSILPGSVDTLRFKIFSRNQIFSLIKNDSIENLPHYLYLRSFEKNDTAYYVSLQNLSCLPFGGGGAIGIYIAKENESFVVKRKMSSSIN